jgi:hypothetical protein
MTLALPSRPFAVAAMAGALALSALGAQAASADSEGTHAVEGNSGSTSVEASIEIAPSLVPVTVSYNTSDGTATAGRDYISRSGSVTFLPGETEKSVRITVLGDTLYEGDETFFLRTSAGGEDGHRITITDDDPAPVVSVGNVTISESGGSARFDATLSAPSAIPATVDYATADGSAQAGSDYVAKTGRLTFAPGETTKTFFVDLGSDTVHEDNETFLVGLSGATGATLAATQATGTIIDDDAAPVVVAHVAASTQTVTALAPQSPARGRVQASFAGLGAGRSVLLDLSCPPGPACSSKVLLTAGARTVGSGAYALGGGADAQLAIRLSRAARRLLSRRGSLRLSALDDAGLLRRFTVRVPRAH